MNAHLATDPGVTDPEPRGTSLGKGAAPGFVRVLEAVASALALAGGVLSGLLILVVLAVTAVSVIGRYLLGSPVPGVDEGIGFLVVAIVMCGAAEALRTGSHIGIDLVSGAAGPRGRRFLDALAHLAVLVFAVLLFRAAWHTVVFSRAFEAYSTGQLEMPLWIPQSTMLLGAGLLGLVALSKLIRTAAGGGGR